jgi:hypothetical protein
MHHLAAADGFLVAQSTMPQFDGDYWLMLASRAIHILGAIILVGGLFYLRMIVAPRLRAGDANAGADPWFAGRRAAWAMWVGIATLALLATGLFNYLQIVKMHERLATSYHMIAGIKIVLALVVFVLVALVSGRSALAERFRQNMKFWLAACLIVAIAVVILGSVLRSYPRELKPIAGPTLIAPN